MKTIIVVDANIILSALLGGKPSKILFDGRFKFVTTRFTVKEVRKYFPSLGKKLGVSKGKLLTLLNKLPLQVYGRDFYKDKLKESQKLIAQVDKKDVEILALTLKFKAYLWSQDKHFKKIEDKTRILKTHDFL